MKCTYQSGEGNGVLVLQGWGTYTHGWEILSSYVYYFFPAILQEAEVWHWIEWDEHVGELARSPSLDMCHWLVRSGWFHRWVMFTLSLQGKGFLEGTTLPPIMTYWGLAELPGKKENTHSEIWSKHLIFSIPHTSTNMCSVLLDHNNSVQWWGSYVLWGNQGSQKCHMSYSTVPSSRGVSTNHKATG